MKLLFGLLVIQLVWYILKQLFTSVSVKVVDIYLHFGEFIVNYTMLDKYGKYMCDVLGFFIFILFIIIIFFFWGGGHFY